MATAENKITAALLENGAWVLRPIEKGLKPLQAIVGGLIQIVPLEDEGVSLFCNEEGKLLGLPPTATWVDPETGDWLDFLAGPLVALGPVDEEGNELPATEATLEILNRFTIPVVCLAV